jgi:8-hydroxy-5-deazaflavin:NADPH oxidoreductase
MNIGILGTGNVGLALGKGWVRENHLLMYGSRNPAKQGDDVYGVGKNAECGSLKDAVNYGDVVVLAVPYRAAADTIKSVGPALFKGKTVLDVTNPLGPSGESLAPAGGSAAEEIQKQMPGAKVVKALNHCFAENMSLGRFGSSKLAGFVAGDDAGAKQTALKLVGDLGFEPIDAGALKAARHLEALAMFLIHLGYGAKMGPGIGFGLLRKK